MCRWVTEHAMPKNCCVPRCKSNAARDPELCYHELPSREKFWDAWLKNISRECSEKGSQWQPSSRSVVRSLHFKGRRTLRAFHFCPSPPFLYPLHILPCPNLAPPRSLGEGSAMWIIFPAESRGCTYRHLRRRTTR